MSERWKSSWKACINQSARSQNRKVDRAVLRDGPARLLFRYPDFESRLDRFGSIEVASDRVALGRCRPRAPTDPYVLALGHTVPQIMDSLRA
jgi:hypothetical protein